MKIKIKDLKKFIRENVEKALSSEDMDRLRRAEDGYGETEFEEAFPIPTPPLDPSQTATVTPGSGGVDMAKVQDAVGQTSTSMAKQLLARAQAKSDLQKVTFWSKVVEIQDELVSQGLRSANEDVDRLRRAEDGYGETEFEEAYPSSTDNLGRPPGPLDYRPSSIDPNQAAKQMSSNAAQYSLDRATKKGDTEAQIYWAKVLDLTKQRDALNKTAPIPVGESTPSGYEKVVKGLKKNPEVDNPWAIANAMKNKGIKPKK